MLTILLGYKLNLLYLWSVISSYILLEFQPFSIKTFKLISISNQQISILIYVTHDLLYSYHERILKHGYKKTKTRNYLHDSIQQNSIQLPVFTDQLITQTDNHSFDGRFQPIQI